MDRFDDLHLRKPPTCSWLFHLGRPPVQLTRSFLLTVSWNHVMPCKHQNVSGLNGEYSAACKFTFGLAKGCATSAAGRFCVLQTHAAACVRDEAQPRFGFVPGAGHCHDGMTLRETSSKPQRASLDMVKPNKLDSQGCLANAATQGYIFPINIPSFSIFLVVFIFALVALPS